MTPFEKQIIFIGVNAGGVGKTFLAETIHAIATILALQTKLASFDQGNHALVRILGEDRVYLINGPIGFAKGREIAANDSVPYDIMVVDTGANSLGGQTGADQLAVGFKMEGEVRGIRVLALMPSGSGKVGGLNSALITYKNMAAAGIESWLILNDVTGSAGFGRDEIPEGTNHCRIPHLPAGFQDLRLASGRPLYDLISDPEPGRELASKYVYAWLYEAAQTLVFHKIFGARLAHLPAPEVDLHGGSLVISTAAETSNDKLKLNVEIRRAQNTLRSQYATLDQLHVAAVQYRNAWLAYHAVDQ